MILCNKCTWPIGGSKNYWTHYSFESCLAHVSIVKIDYVDFVYEPGQFSVRGGIVDIYSYGNQYPYRIELLDEDVESIRTFDPSSQLSTQKIAFVTIVPNVNTQFEQNQKKICVYSAQKSIMEKQ